MTTTLPPPSFLWKRTCPSLKYAEQHRDHLAYCFAVRTGEKSVIVSSAAQNADTIAELSLSSAAADRLVKHAVDMSWKPRQVPSPAAARCRYEREGSTMQDRECRILLGLTIPAPRTFTRSSNPLFAANNGRAVVSFGQIAMSSLLSQTVLPVRCHGSQHFPLIGENWW